MESSIHFTDLEETVLSNNKWLVEQIEKRKTKLLERKKYQFLMVFYYQVLSWIHQNNAVREELGREDGLIREASRLVGFYVEHCHDTEPGTEVKLTFEGQELVLLVTAFKDISFTLSQALYLAVIADDEEAIRQLSFSTVDLIFFPEKVGFQYVKAVLALFSTFLVEQRIDQVQATRLKSIAQSAEEIVPEFKPDFSFHVYLLQPFVKGLEALQNGDQPAVQEAINEAIERHRAYWTSSKPMNPGDPPLSREESGWLSLPVCALCRLAVKRGFNVEANSGYAPARLWRGV